MSQVNEEAYDVFLYEEKVGNIYRKGDLTRFDFTDEYWEKSTRAVLSLYYEDRPKERYTNMRLPPWFSNLLPEGRLREWIAESSKTSVEREMELLAQVGHDLPGAIRVFKGKSMFLSQAKDAEPHEEFGSEFQKRLWSFSLAGVGLKFSMLAEEDRLTIPATGENGDWIVKLPDQRHQNVPHNEFSMMSLAREVGIDVPETRLVHRDSLPELPSNAWPATEEWAYAIRRFDRGSNRELIHIEDFAQVRGFYPNFKYQGSFETVAALSYRGTDVDGLREFARRMTLNLLIGNGDAHLKNWSLIYYDRRVPKLAPAYDLVSTFVYRPLTEGPEDMGLKLGGSRRFGKVTLSSFENIERKLSVNAGLADIVADTTAQVLNAWQSIEGQLVSTPFSNQIHQHIQMRATQLLSR